MHQGSEELRLAYDGAFKMATYASKCLCQADTQRQEPWGPQSGEKMASEKNSAYRVTLRCDIGASGGNCDFSLWDLSLKEGEETWGTRRE